jgi:LacI family transcriptional regulator
MVHKDPAKVRIKDLAQTLGLSMGTIDRALNNRPEISIATREKVLKTARRMGYHPDLVASVLSSKRRLRIAVNLPRGVTPFHEEVRVGIEEEHAALGKSLVNLEYFHFPGLGSGEMAALDRAMKSGMDGMIISSTADTDVKERLIHLIQLGVPIVCVGTDIPGVDTVATVTIDPFVSGSLAGELVGRLSANPGPIAIVTGDTTVTNHRQKVESFQSTIQQFFPSLDLLPAIEAHDNVEEAYEKSMALLRAHPDLTACYISTGNSIAVLKALKDSRMPGKTMVLTTDLLKQLLPHIRSNRVAGTLYQRPRQQGATAYRILHHYLSHGQRPAQPIRLDPYLIMRANLDAFLVRRPLPGR